MANWEFLILPDISAKAIRALTALAETTQDKVVTEEYKGDSPWLVIQGYGGKRQLDIIARHKANGGRVLAIDFGYWARDEGSIRISIDENHPEHLLKFAEGRRDNGFTPPALEDVYSPNGHIVVAGLGPKSRVLYGFDKFEWEEAQIERLKKAYPKRKIWYRPKPNQPHEKIPGTINGSVGPIVNVLRGSALCVVYHSNVAVDCAQYGIPCVATKGVGAFAYNDDIVNPKRLLGEERADFFHRLNWFNWKPNEFSGVLPFALYLGECTK